MKYVLAVGIVVLLFHLFPADAAAG